MPLAGLSTRALPYPLYFDNFAALDTWRASVRGPIDHAEGVMKYVPRALTPEDDIGKGKLLVSHDFKNNYVEDPFNKSYTFNWWSSTHHFNYFSHRRITLPPPEWITAAHRAGSTMLGTIIFEGNSAADMLRMIMGRVPGMTAAQARARQTATIPLGPYYAKLFAELAAERGFDGYLLNIEIGLGRGSEEARALAGWITILQAEMVKRVGPHAQTIWYDSVTTEGWLWWQNRLNSRNLPWFLQSTGIFTNYWWSSDWIAQQEAYFNAISTDLTGQTADPHPQLVPRGKQDIYNGIDVWGRGSHGGGGFGAYRALDHIAPMTSGQSCALFAQGWTWETEEEKPGWNWDRFWDYDTSLWAGPATPGSVTVPPLGLNPGEPRCEHGEFTPISKYFPHLPPPEPYDLPFYTNFCPGVGDAWFVEGRRVWNSTRGWTDIDKQTLVGDLIWPRPTVTRLDDRSDAAPIGLTKMNMADAWNGGNSIRITLDILPSDNGRHALWVPIQTLNLYSRRRYQATAVYKPEARDAETEFALGLRSAAGQDLMKIISSSLADLANGWRKATVEFELESSAGGPQVLTQGQLGLVVAVVSSTPSSELQVPFLVGQLAVHPAVPAKYKEYDLFQQWIYFEPNSAATPLTGTLNWEVGVSFDRVVGPINDDPEDPGVPWNLQPTVPWFPKFLYFNVYAQQLPGGAGSEPGPLTWLGTTTYTNVGDKKQFYVVQENLPFSSGQRRYDFKVQPVFETGEVYSEWVSFTSASASPTPGRGGPPAAGEPNVLTPEDAESVRESLERTEEGLKEKLKHGFAPPPNMNRRGMHHRRGGAHDL